MKSSDFAIGDNLGTVEIMNRTNEMLIKLLQEWYESRDEANKAVGHQCDTAEKRYGEACVSLAAFLRDNPPLRQS